MGKDGARVRMNIATHQENKEKEKTGMREAGEERKQSIDFRETAWCPSAVVQKAARQKNISYMGNARGNWGSREGRLPFLPNPNGIEDRIITLRRLLISAEFICFGFKIETNKRVANMSEVYWRLARLLEDWLRSGFITKVF